MAEQGTKDESVKVEPYFLKNNRVTAEVALLGAFLNSLTIDGENVLYPRTEENPKRGGIPILGPTPGPVSGTEWENLYPNMPSHGVDRAVLWKVKQADQTRLILERNITPKEFLFNGRAKIEIELLDNGVRISKSITNLEDKPREMGSAFHPYFSFGENSKVRTKSVASHYPLKAGKPQTIKPGVALVQFEARGTSYKIQAEPDPMVTVLWSDKPELYTCIEPWWAESGKGDIIGPRETKIYSLTITKT